MSMLSFTMCNKILKKVKRSAALAVLCFSIIMLYMGSRTPDKESDLVSINRFIVDSVYLPISELNHQQGRIKTVSNKKCDGQLVAFLNSNSFTLYFYDLEKGTKQDSLSLADYKNGFVDFFPVSVDSVYVAQENNKVTLISSRKTQAYPVNQLTEKISPSAFIGILSAESLQVMGDTVMCITSTWEPKRREGPNIPFRKANYDIVFRLSSGVPQHISRHNPNPAYFQKQDYYSFVERAYINSHTLVYSYSHSDTLMLHDMTTGQTKNVKLRTRYFTPNKPFDYSQVMDYKYIKEYWMAETRMGDLFYDKSRRRVYQLMKHKGRYLEDDGSKNATYDLPYSLFVLDENLVQQKEIYIPPGTFASSYFAFTTNNGLYYAAHPSHQKHHNKMLFYRLVIL